MIFDWIRNELCKQGVYANKIKNQEICDTLLKSIEDEVSNVTDEEMSKKHCPVFCIQRSGALSSLMCLQKLKLIMIFNSRVLWYLIMHKKIATKHNFSQLFECDGFDGRVTEKIGFFFLVIYFILFFFLLILFCFFLYLFVNHPIFQELSTWIFNNLG